MQHKIKMWGFPLYISARKKITELIIMLIIALSLRGLAAAAASPTDSSTAYHLGQTTTQRTTAR